MCEYYNSSGSDADNDVFADSSLSDPDSRHQHVIHSAHCLLYAHCTPRYIICIYIYSPGAYRMVVQSSQHPTVCCVMNWRSSNVLVELVCHRIAQHALYITHNIITHML